MKLVTTLPVTYTAFTYQQVLPRHKFPCQVFPDIEDEKIWQVSPRQVPSFLPTHDTSCYNCRSSALPWTGQTKNDVVKTVENITWKFAPAL